MIRQDRWQVLFCPSPTKNAEGGRNFINDDLFLADQLWQNIADKAYKNEDDKWVLTTVSESFHVAYHGKTED